MTTKQSFGLSDLEQKALVKLFSRYNWVALVGRTPGDSIILHEGFIVPGLQNFNTTLDLKTQVATTVAIAFACDEEGNIIIGSNGQPQMAVIKT